MRPQCLASANFRARIISQQPDGLHSIPTIDLFADQCNCGLRLLVTFSSSQTDFRASILDTLFVTMEERSHQIIFRCFESSLRFD